MAEHFDHKAWAKKMASRIESGEKAPYSAEKLAAGALGMTFLPRGGKHARRPDVADLRAGDRHDD